MSMKARLPQGMGGGAQNVNSMIKQAQKMQEQIAAVQEDIAAREFPVTVGGGAVEIVLNGDKTVKSLSIKPEVCDPDDVEMLQDLIISAINECHKNIEQTSEAEINKITGGVSLPGLF